MNDRKKKATDLAREEWSELKDEEKSMLKVMENTHFYKDGEEPETVKALCRKGLLLGMGYGNRVEWEWSSWGRFVSDNRTG